MNWSTLGFSAFYHLLELPQTHVHWVNDAIQPSYLLPLCLLLLPSIFPSIRVFFFFFFPNELALSIRGPKYWSFSFSISPSNQDSGLISFRTDWFYFHAVHGVPRVFSSISVQKWECKLVQPLWRTMWRFPKKLEIELPYDPAIPLLGIHTEETRSKETRVPQCSSQHCL